MLTLLLYVHISLPDTHDVEGGAAACWCAEGGVHCTRVNTGAADPDLLTAQSDHVAALNTQT